MPARLMRASTVHRRPDNCGPARTAHKLGPSPGPIRHNRGNHATHGSATQTYELPGQNAKSPTCIFASYYILERSAQQSTASWTSAWHPAMLSRLRHQSDSGLQPRYIYTAYILRNPHRDGRKKRRSFSVCPEFCGYTLRGHSKERAFSKALQIDTRIRAVICLMGPPKMSFFQHCSLPSGREQCRSA